MIINIKPDGDFIVGVLLTLTLFFLLKLAFNKDKMCKCKKVDISLRDTTIGFFILVFWIYGFYTAFRGIFGI